MKDQNYLIKAYFAFALLIVIGGGFFYFQSEKWSRILDLSAPAKEEAQQLAEAEKQYLAEQGLTRDPGELSYVEIVTGKDGDFSDLETLRVRDTDQDDLNDYEELYLYRTSPYLGDTDGDNLSDALEIKQGTDPLCPEGKVCGNDELALDIAQKKQLLEQLSGAGESLDDWQNSLSSLDLASIPADVLREALVEGGMAEEDLAQLSDADLLALYQEAKDSLEEASPVTENDTATLDEDSLLALTPDQLRALLIQQGADAVKLEEISDADLLYFLEESIKESKENVSNDQ